MASVLVIVVSVISLFATPVTGQMDIVSVKTIVVGLPFKITCDAQRVTTAQENFSTISTLQIFVLSNGAHNYSMLAQYTTLPLHEDTDVLQNPPEGRKWQFNFNGSNSENRGANNKATMKIEILVSDAKCADAGLYKCIMRYSIKGVVRIDNRIQNVTSTAKTTEPIIVLDPLYDAPPGITNSSAYDLGANITVSCTFMGPEELSVKWKREVRPAMGVDLQYEDYPIMKDITTDIATRQPGTSAACPEYAHKSVLNLTISEDDHQRRYLCVVMSDNKETASSAAYIEIMLLTSGSTTPSSGNLTNATGSESTTSSGHVFDASGKPDNIILVVGLALGIPLAIIILVIIILHVFPRRSKGSNTSAQEADRPVSKHEEYVPPPVSSSAASTSSLSSSV